MLQLLIQTIIAGISILLLIIGGFKRSGHMSKYLALFLALFLICVCAFSDEPATADQEYVKTFVSKKPKVDPPAVLESYATQARYDAIMEQSLDKALVGVSNDNGGIAWWLSYYMMSLNEMYRATNDAKYLAANLKLIKAIQAATDDKLGKKLWTGRVVKAWGCDTYAERRALFAVHTGVITAPMFEFLALAKSDERFFATLGEDAKTVLDGATAAIAEHDRQWRDGPEPGAGNYVGLDQEKVCEGKPLPGNRLSAMGWALWASWKYTGNTVHRDRAVSIGTYIKNRLSPSPDGAYYWPYWLSADPVAASTVPDKLKRENISGEDSSHASLTFQLPLLLSQDGQVFTRDDMQRIGKMIVNGLGRLNAGEDSTNAGIIFGDITGSPKSSPANIANAARWLALAPFEPRVREIIVSYYLNYEPSPSPLELAQLIRAQK